MKSDESVTETSESAFSQPANISSAMLYASNFSLVVRSVKWDSMCGGTERGGEELVEGEEVVDKEGGRYFIIIPCSWSPTVMKRDVSLAEAPPALMPDASGSTTEPLAV